MTAAGDSPEQRLAALGLSLPEVVPPLAVYVPAVRSGLLVWTSGQLPMRDGRLLATGKVDADVSEAVANECARQCALSAIAAVRALVGDLSRVRRVVKVVGYVASSPAFTKQPGVVNGASELLGDVFGGQHARSAVGVAVLPLDAPVELEVVVELAEAE